mmetsp:Transcript_75583/g.130832  ORF Transcript_75583/g.130832 Transcript_75583/m.130832 type:complete len:362 (-) Transcript_75583:225-1310(-)
MGYLDVQIPSSNANIVEKHTFLDVQSDDDANFARFGRRKRAMSDSLIELPCFETIESKLSDGGDDKPNSNDDNGSTCSDITDGLWSVCQEETSSSPPLSSPRTPEIPADSDGYENEVPAVGQTMEAGSTKCNAVCSPFPSGVYAPCVWEASAGLPMPIMDYVVIVAPVAQACSMPPPGIWITNSCHDSPLQAGLSGSASEARENTEQHPTTVIVRNLPTGSLLGTVLKALDDEGYSGFYDFVHVPVELTTKSSMGYGLVNFVDHATAVQFLQQFQGFGKWALPDHVSNKECTVEWNMTQGLQVHVERYRNSRLMHWSVAPEFRPALFSNGMQVAFPPPTVRIKAPRMRPGRPMSGKADVDC